MDAEDLKYTELNCKLYMNFQLGRELVPPTPVFVSDVLIHTTYCNNSEDES